MTTEPHLDGLRKPCLSLWRRTPRWLAILLYGFAVWLYAFWIHTTLVFPLWHWWHSKDMYLLGGNLGEVSAVRFSPSGKTLYSLSRNNTASMLTAWDVDSGKILHQCKANWPMALSQDG